MFGGRQIGVCLLQRQAGAKRRKVSGVLSGSGLFNIVWSGKRTVADEMGGGEALRRRVVAHVADAVQGDAPVVLVVNRGVL